VKTLFALILILLPSLAMGQAIPLATITPVNPASPVRAGSATEISLRVQVPEGLHAQSNKPRDPSLIPTTLQLELPSTVSVVETVFPPSTDFVVQGFDQPLAVFEGAFQIKVRLDVSADHPSGELSVPGRFRYQACDNKSCYPPRTIATTWSLNVTGGRAAAPAPAAPTNSSTPSPVGETAQAGPSPATVPAAGSEIEMFDRFAILGSTGGYQNAADFVGFIKNAEAGVKQVGLFEGRGWLAILALVFVGGLMLNLTPCVLPMIPINLAIIGAGSQGANKRRGFWLGASYGAAMALVYGVLGLVVILTAGTFGTINASPWFNLGIAILFVFLGLAMFDVFELDFSRFSSNIRFDDKSRGTFYLAFGMGSVAALLAGACVAPVVIQVIVFASNLYLGGTTAALALPFFLGLGMALPWPFAGAGLSALPKPGMWMVRVKQVMGVFILASAAYYGYLAYGIFSSRWVDPAVVAASVEDKIKEGWHASLIEGLQAAERENKPVLVDFWATWCKNCFTMDATTLKDPAVKEALSSYTLIKFQAEDPDAPPAREIMKRIGAVGLPAYAILRPRQ
jgi:thiol:disulfide interchange protein DsbD